MDTADETLRRSIAAVWRIESAKIVATVARMVRDVGVAEDLAQDALIAAKRLCANRATAYVELHVHASAGQTAKKPESRGRASRRASGTRPNSSVETRVGVEEAAFLE